MGNNPNIQDSDSVNTYPIYLNQEQAGCLAFILSNNLDDGNIKQKNVPMVEDLGMKAMRIYLDLSAINAASRQALKSEKSQ